MDAVRDFFECGLGKPFGLHLDQTCPFGVHGMPFRQESKLPRWDMRTFHNWTNALGWFPVLGIISAIFQLWAAKDLKCEYGSEKHIKDMEAWRKGLCIRAGMQIAGLGPALFFIDMGITVFRMHQHKRTNPLH